MEAEKFSLRARSVLTDGLPRPCLLALLFLLSACAPPNTELETHSYAVHWDLAIPVRDYVYLGDNPPECTDARVHIMAFRRDRTLMICTGGQHGDGWLPLVIGEKAP